MRRKNRSSARPGRAGAADEPSRWSDASLARKASWATIAGLPIAGLAVALALVSPSGGSNDDGDAPSAATTTAAKAPALTKDDVVVIDRLGNADAPRIEALVHNAGTARSVVTRAELRVERVESLEQCASQGDLPLSNAYDVRLPVEAGDVASVALHQQLAPDEADRFALDLASEQPNGPDGAPRIWLYQLNVALFHDGRPTPLDLGEVVVTVPDVPAATSFYWTAETADYVRDWLPPGAYKANAECWLRNTERLHAVLALPGARAPDLARVAREMIVPYEP